ncbi:heat-inducible transcriptional repressor HrcA [Terriglobus saanensis]|uniref:Heat-inducible transcription repressor HrcA n=1 Tax=Terriglobus saanensis (strain ATCC BAA-1853 / DSM 23119 / SP1PR4) TaxID=401053 RepID=E8V6G2_TERSS|nr:heat-inducible transcriptional repressor HrcA [Terriglobus saanensis]ADV81627.1 heat-inducible transcription repressor HrcA [Terriglobus saanensis SP1PR4]
MQNEINITARQRAILTEVVESYISTGEPVASQNVAQALANLSSATVRNTMAELADAGLLEQPHTSAGRIPTARAFRIYVEQLNGNDRIHPALLSSRSRSQIDSSFEGIAGTQAFLERTSHVLATLSSGVGVALASVDTADLLEHVHFSRLAVKKVLAVVVLKSGLVRDRVLALDRDLDLRELEAAARFLNENFRGWSVERVRVEIQQRTEQERNEYQRLLAAVKELWSGAVPEGEQQIYVEGVSNLMMAPALGQEEREHLREMLVALEAKERLVALLNAYVDARQESVRAVFDLDEYAPAMQGLVLIAAPARLHGENRGAVGVIGPKRMQYEKTMNTVGYVAQLFDRMRQASDESSTQ